MVKVGSCRLPRVLVADKSNRFAEGRLGSLNLLDTEGVYR
jgi:hypothetical protein